MPPGATAPAPGRTGPRPHRPPAARPRRRTALPPQKATVSTNLTFERSLHRRLCAFAQYHGKTLSQVVSEACAPVVRGVRIVMPGQADDDGDGAAG